MVTPTPTTVQVKLQLRADTAAIWASVNPVLLNNELALETDTKKLKVGDGTTAWNSLAYFPFVVSGGTVTGNLEIGTTGTLTFEGSTADGFETTLAVTDPTADRTITLPDQSGTVVVTGNASIVNADIAADAEIAVSKLANGTVNQVLVTDGTDVSWSDDLTLAGNLTVNGTTTTVNTETLTVKDKNIELAVVDTPTDTTADGGGITLKGATDKTITWSDTTDAWTSNQVFDVPTGSAAAPSLIFGADVNSGIYSPGADQVAISTGGTEKLRITSDGKLGLGTSSPNSNLEIAYSSQSPSLSATNAGLSLYGTSTLETNFGSDPNSPYGAWIQTRGRATNLAFPLCLNPLGGNVGIGTTAPAAQLHAYAASGAVTLRAQSGASVGDFAQSGTDLYVVNAANGPISFWNNGSEKARIDSSGRLLVGTSSALTTTNALTAKLQSAGNSVFDTGISTTLFTADTSPASLHLVKSRNATTGSHTVVQSGDGLGRIVFGGSDGTDFEPAAFIEGQVDGTPGANDMPGRLVFSTTPDGSAAPVERMRITNDGDVYISTTLPVGPAETNAGFTYDRSSITLNLAKSSGAAFNIQRLTTDGNAAVFYRDTTAVGTISVTTTATAYNTSSDYRLKENVVPLTGAADRVKQLKPSQFNFIAEPDKTVDGFLAHEAQAVVPEAVYGTKDEVDADGNPVYQGIDQSKLVPLLTAALQEALERIEVLEAKVNALKGN